MQNACMQFSQMQSERPEDEGVRRGSGITGESAAIAKRV